MTHADVQAWLDRYIAAWKSYDPEAIGALYSDDATQRFHPWDEPIVGREAIVHSWVDERDEPRTYDASYEPYAVEGDRAVAVGQSDYFSAPGGSLERRYHNVFLLEFDADGRCRSFTEIFLKEA
jgi:ketosteroid isomerase-like protein